MAKYQKYAEYKDSGIKWLGFVPSHWAIAGFKKYLESTVDYRGKTPEKVEEGIFLVTARNIKNGVVNYSLSQEYVALKDYDEIMSRGKPLLGDVLFTTEAPLGEVAQIDKEDIALAQRIIKFRGKKNILDNTYLKYFILSQQFQDSLMTFATGSTALGIKAERLGYLQQCIPPINEQLKIANFLDHETAQIDTLIAKQEKLIELLKEKRQAVISHAVTKGLNPNVPMKDSGVEWLGEVPEHWTVSKLKYFASIQGGFAFSSDLFIEEGTQVLRIGNVYQNCLSLDRQPIFIANDLVKNFQDFLVKKNDVLMSLTGTLGKRDYGFAIKIETDDQYLLNQRVAKISAYKNIDTDFMIYVLWSESYLTQLYSLPSGTKQANLSNSDVLGIEIIVPPSMEEQKNIARYIKDKLEKFDEMILKAESAIQLMQERRTALISAAVTGKIDVRHWQHPNQKNNNNTELSA